MLEGVDINALIALVGVGISGGGVGAWWSRRTAVDKLAADASSQIRDALRERVSELEAAGARKDERNDEITLELGELRGDKRALEGKVEVLERDLEARTGERDEARVERDEARQQLGAEVLAHAQTRADRDRYRVQRNDALRALQATAPQTADVLLADADDADSLHDIEPGEGWQARSLSEASDGTEADS